MERTVIARKTITLVALLSVAAGVLVLPADLRLFVALLAVPLEVLMLTSLLTGPSPQMGSSLPALDHTHA